MIDRNGSFSPKENERGPNNGSQGGSLLTEASFLARSKEERDETKEVISNISEISFVLKTTTLNTRVSNLRSGITNPIIDHMTMVDNREKDISTRRHKESILAYSSIRREIERSSEKNAGAVTSTMRDTYYSMTKSVASALGTIIKPVFKMIGAGLFGSKKERSVVQAIDDQTQFLRSGRILDNSTIFSRTMQRGLVGSVLTGVSAGVFGLGNKTAQSAEDKRSAGEELNFREKLTTTMGVQLGWFKNFDRKNTKKTFDKNDPQAKQSSLLDRIRLGIESSLQYMNSTSQIFLNEFVDTKNILAHQTNVLRDSIQLSAMMVAGQIEESSGSLILAYRSEAREAGTDLSYYNSRQNNILDTVKDEMIKLNNPMPSEYQYRALYIQNQQYEELQKANELAAEAAEDRKPETKGSGGLIGMAMSLGSLLFNSKTAAVIAGLGKKFIIAPVMGAIKAGGAWLMRNGFKLILRAPFAKIFAIVGITGLMYKYLARPLIDWFDNTFDTDIGGAIDRFGTMISNKFYGMLDWIRQKMASVPLIGRFFEKDDKVPKVPEGQKNNESGGILSSMGDALSGGWDGVKNAGSDVVGWYGQQWSDMASTAGDALGEVSDGLSRRFKELKEDASEAYQGGIDRIRGYDPTALSSMRQQAMSSGQLAQDALGSMINPAMSQSPTITSDMERAAFESRDAMMQQWNEMKEQRQEVGRQNQQMLEMMAMIAGNTEQGVRATMASGKETANALKNKDNHSVPGDY